MFNMKTLMMKLCNPVKFRLWNFIFNLKSNPESLLIRAEIGASKPVLGQEALAYEGAGIHKEEVGRYVFFCDNFK